MDFLNKDCTIKYYRQPYPLIIFENFLEKSFYDSIEKNFPKIADFKSQKNKINRMHHDTSYGDKLYEKLIKKTPEYKKLHNYIYSEFFIKYFVDLFKKDIELEIKNKNLIEISDYQIQPNPFEIEKIISKNDIKDNENQKILYPRLDLGMGLLNYGKDTGGKGIHVDNPQRLISILLYLGGYKKIEGGELRIWKKELEKLNISKVIKPTPNTLVASLQTNSSFHDVNPVTKIDGSRNACYIAISSNNNIWKNLENNQFNKKFHKNRIKKINFFQKLKNFFFNFINNDN